MIITCPQCKNDVDLPIGKVNAAKKINAPVYCGRVCSGLARRKNKSTEQKKAEKAEYDKLYRENNLELLKAKKHEYFKKTYDPAAAAIERKKNMAHHVEYCRQPKYREKKKVYDKQYRAKKNFGEFWESALIMSEIEKHIDDRQVRQQNNLHNKSQKRKRLWEQQQKHNLPR